MPKITIGMQSFESEKNESVLDTLLRNGIDAPYSCRSGACQSCLLRCEQGIVPDSARSRLKATLQARGYFLGCMCYPKEDLTVSLSELGDVGCEAVVTEISRLSEEITRLRIKPEQEFPYFAGQFINIVRSDGLTRSYSIASLPERDPWIELHIRAIPDGQMSQWIAHELRVDDTISIRGPGGDCFYIPSDTHKNIVLIGTGTGLAPLYGIIQDAIRKGHLGKLVLFHAALQEKGLYLVPELTEIAAKNSQFLYYRCVLQGEEKDSTIIGDIKEVVKNHFSSLSGWRVYLCGDPPIVNALRREAFLKGASMKEIHADPFLMTKPKS